MTNNMPESVSVARYLISRIEELGPRVIPVLQGGVIMKLIDEVGQSSTLSYVVPNHEQALAMMVDASARLSGFGVGFASSGPGAVNLMTGIACSYYDSVPCMYVTGQVGTFHLRKSRAVRQRGFQESDIVSLMEPITKYVTVIEKADDVRYELEKALAISQSGRPGPVVLDLPYDIQRQMVNSNSLNRYSPQHSPPDGDALKRQARFIVEKIMGSKRPLLLVGGGVRLSGMGEEARKLALKTKIPVVTTWSSADIFSNTFPSYLGKVGKSGDRAAVDAVQESDFLLCLGSRFTPKVIINEKEFAKNAEICAVDVDEAELREALIDIDFPVVTDLRALLPLLVETVGNGPVGEQGWISGCIENVSSKRFQPDLADPTGNSVNPFQFAENLMNSMKDDAILFADSGANLTWVMQGAKPRKEQRIISAWGNSPMGYALPAAIGAKLSAPAKQVVAAIGDGGFQMNIQELQTLIGNQVDVKVFIFNNRCYGNIKMGARREFESRIHGNDASTGYTVPDFLAVAKAYGLATASVRNDSESAATIEKVLNSKGAIIVNVDIHPDQEHTEMKL